MVLFTFVFIVMLIFVVLFVFVMMFFMVFFMVFFMFIVMLFMPAVFLMSTVTAFTGKMSTYCSVASPHGFCPPAEIAASWLEAVLAPLILKVRTVDLSVTSPAIAAESA